MEMYQDIYNTITPANLFYIEYVRSNKTLRHSFIFFNSQSQPCKSTNRALGEMLVKVGMVSITSSLEESRGLS